MLYVKKKTKKVSSGKQLILSFYTGKIGFFVKHHGAHICCDDVNTDFFRHFKMRLKYIFNKWSIYSQSQNAAYSLHFSVRRKQKKYYIGQRHKV
jgi:hypothetical protein